MIHLRSARLGAIDADLADTFPFNVPVIRALAGSELAFTSEVTLQSHTTKSSTSR